MTTTQTSLLDRLAAVEERYEELERLMADPEVAVDYARVQEHAKEHSSIRNLAALARGYRQVLADTDEARTLSRDDSDKEMVDLAREELQRLDGEKERIEQELRVALLPKDPNDDKNVIMEIRAGTGGEEAGLFAAELYRMYSRHAQRNGWKIDVININETGLGSVKEVVFAVKAKGAYSRLKHESGTHRVQRVPVTESGGRIHTSAATVAVLPEAEEVDGDVRPDDLNIEIAHASGHGGQNVQKVATAVRITHIPTGIVAFCQDERSQLKNKEKAMAVLRSRLLASEIEKQQQEITESRRSQVGTGDRSGRVRTYNFPQDRVTDHRISLTTHNIEQILDGDIDVLITALQEAEQASKLAEAGM